MLPAGRVRRRSEQREAGGGARARRADAPASLPPMTRLPPAPDPRRAQSPAPGAATAAAGLLALAVFAALAVGAGAGAGPSRLDRAVTAWAVAARRGALTPAVRVLTDLGGTTGLTIGTVLVAALLLARRLHRRALVLAAAMAGSAGLTVALRLVFARPRPPAGLLVDEALSTYSFPSGHSFNTAVFVGALAGFVLFSPASGRRKAVAASGAVAAATAVGLSRVYLAHHWFTDVLAGWALAAAWLCLVALVVRRLPAGRRRGRR